MIKQVGVTGLTILCLALLDSVEARGQKVGSIAESKGTE